MLMQGVDQQINALDRIAWYIPYDQQNDLHDVFIASKLISAK